MSGYKEYIEIDPDSDNIDLIDEDRTVDTSGRVSVGRDKEGETYEKIILIKNDGPVSE